MKAIATILILTTLSILASFTPYKNNTVTSGATVFMNNCAVCHGSDRLGRFPLIPSLKNVQEQLNKDSVLAILNTGRNCMPSFKYFSNHEKEEVLAYLFNESKTPQEIIPKMLTVNTNGAHLFYANCAGCHKIYKTDSRPVNQQDRCMKPAVLSEVISQYDLNNFTLVLDKGPCYMPSLSYFNPKQKQTIFKYVKAIATTKDNGSDQKISCNANSFY